MTLLKEAPRQIERSSFLVQRIVKCTDELGSKREVINRGCGASFYVSYPSGWTKEELAEVLKEKYSDHRHHRPMTTIDLSESDLESELIRSVREEFKGYTKKRGRPAGSKNRPKEMRNK